MGQDTTITYTRKELRESLDAIFDHNGIVFIKVKFIKHFRRLLKQFQLYPPITNTNQGLHISKVVFYIYQNNKYLHTVQKLGKLFLESINQLFLFPSLLFVHHQKWQEVVDIGKLLSILSNDKMWQILNNMFDMNDFDVETAQIINKIKINNLDQVIIHFASMLIIDEINRMEQLLMGLMLRIIRFRESIQTRSQKAFQIIEQLQYLCFTFYLKLYFCSQHHNSVKYKIYQSQEKYLDSFKVGINNNKPSIYDLSVMYLQTLSHQNKYSTNNIYIQPHLYHNIPMYQTKQITIQIIYYCLFAIRLRHKGLLRQNFSINAICSYKLVLCFMPTLSSYHQQIQYLMEYLSLITTNNTIQRSYLFKIVQIFVKNGHQQSNILKNYLASLSKQPYHLSLFNIKQQASIQMTTILECLQGNDKLWEKQQLSLNQKFIYDVLLNKPLVDNVNDQEYWKIILQLTKSNTQFKQLNQMIEFDMR